MKSGKILLVALILILALFSGCSQSGTDSTNTGEQAKDTEVAGEQADDTQVTGVEVIGEWSINVEVVGKEPFEFTNKDAEKIGAVEIVAAEKNGGEETWVGIPLEAFLDYINVEKVSVISVEGADGDIKELEPERISENGVGFGWMVNGEVLDAERGPIQLINHDRGPKWWVKQVSKITIIE